MTATFGKTVGDAGVATVDGLSWVARLGRWVTDERVLCLWCRETRFRVPRGTPDHTRISPCCGFRACLECRR